MKNIKLVIEYDGTRYKGFQRLKNSDNTIQQKVEEVLSKMAGHHIEIIGSGRTDAGVHAYDQVVNFHIQTSLSPEEILDYCNQYLPEDIVVKEVAEVDERFHARYNVKSKKYIYRIWNGRIPTVFNRKYSYYIREDLDVEEMQKAAALLIGVHDFSAYSAVKGKGKSTEREIYNIEISKKGPRIEIIYHGNGFLHKMVRIITGTLIQVGLKEKHPQEVKKILLSLDREKAGPTAPAQGLTLMNVFYE